MRILLPTFLSFALAPLACSQEPQKPEAEKPKAEKAEKAGSQQGKDDAVTAKDEAIKTIDAFLEKKAPSKKQGEWRTLMVEPPKLTFSADRDYFWNLQTNKGPITIKLMTKTAPMHASNIVYLTRAGFYDGTVFHRVIQGFMAQGGDPLGNGTGGPGYYIDGEYDPKVKHDRAGILSTANTGRPKSDGSQFFLTFGPTPHLDGKHTIAGEVTAGMDTVKELEKRGSQDGSGRTSEKLTIDRAWISVAERGKPAEKPKDASGEKEGGAAKEGSGK